MNTKNVIIKFHHNSMTAETLDNEQRRAHMNTYMWLVDNTEAIEDKKVVYDDYVQQCEINAVKAYFTENTFRNYFGLIPATNE